MKQPEPTTPAPSEQYGSQPQPPTTQPTMPPTASFASQPTQPTMPPTTSFAGQPTQPAPQSITSQPTRPQPFQPGSPQHRRTLSPLIIGLIALIILVLIIILIASQSHNTAVIQPGDNSPRTPASLTRSIHVGDHALLSIRTHGGDVSVHTAQTDQITVVPRSPDHNDETYFKDVNVLYNQNQTAQGHDHLSISTDPYFKNVDFDITIPSDASVEINVGSGSLDIHGGTGAALTTGSGSIELDNIQGPVTAHTDSGDLTVDTVSGPTVLEGISGTIKTTNTHGQLKATTTNGDVIIRQAALSGQSLLKTRNGSVRFDGTLDPQGSYTMQTTNGDVQATLPANAAFTLDGNTTNGSVQNDFASSTVGSAPRAQLSMSTQNGSVIVTKAG